MRVVFELLRIIVIVGFLGALGSTILAKIYAVNGAAETYSWLGAIGIVILLFVLYRNKLQFTGWYKGKRGHKLKKKLTFILTLTSILFIMSPFLLGLIN
ncbi:hypothetical protein [Halobacillus rhizosphaerae]|uniref:hypothetical protein n=1 Tax=Halobacillus rhizosphaerae TaxID=3064889 RepID=UPI00398AC8B3